jgi:hypothetical protein
VFFALPLPFFFAWPSTSDATAKIGNGVINAVGQYWWTRALSLAPPSAVGPFYYFMVCCAWICFLRRCADLHIGCRLRNCGRLRPVPALARSKQEAARCRPGDK